MTKRKLCAGAMIAALCLPGAAFAEVTLYGKAHLSLENQNDGTHSGVFVSSNSSRFGVKGSMDFGNGLTGFAQLESGVDATGEGATNGDGNGGQPNAQGQLFTRARDTFAGLKGGWGAVKIGRLSEGAANAWVYDVNYFGDQLGDAANLTSAGAGGRADSTVNYALPEMGGFGLNISYTPENSTATTAESSKGVNLSFGTKAFTVGAHYFDFGNTTALPNPKVTSVTGTFNFDAGSVGAAYVKSKDEGGVSGHDRNIWTLGAGFNLGGGTLKAQYTKADKYDDAANTGAKQTALGYDYPIGKNGTVYAVYAKMDNDSAASFTPADWGHGKAAGPVAAGKSPNGIGVGFIYNFGATWQ
jgi:predicted porin